jgi:hypothetical protein
MQVFVSHNKLIRTVLFKVYIKYTWQIRAVSSLTWQISTKKIYYNIFLILPPWWIPRMQMFIPHTLPWPQFHFHFVDSPVCQIKSGQGESNLFFRQFARAFKGTLRWKIDPLLLQLEKNLFLLFAEYMDQPMLKYLSEFEFLLEVPLGHKSANMCFFPEENPEMENLLHMYL